MKHLEHSYGLKSLTKKQRFFLLFLSPTYSTVIGLFLQPIQKIGLGIMCPIKEPDFLVTDCFVVGSVGAILINADALTFTSIGIIHSMGIDMDSHTITFSCLMFGFSLSGKNPLSIWATLAEVYLYVRYHKMSMCRRTYIGLHETSLSPITTQMMQAGDLPLVMRLAIALAVGLVISFVLSPLSTHARSAHKRYSLCNVGPTASIIVTVIVSVLKFSGVEIESRLIWPTGDNEVFGIVLPVLLGGTIILGTAVWDRSIWESHSRIIKSYGIGGTNYLRDGGSASTMFSMGANELSATYFMPAMGGELNGPTICGIFIAVGFGATGKHLRNIALVMMGVYLVSFTRTRSIYQPSSMLALLSSTILIPVAEGSGVVAGTVVGYLYSPAVLNVGIVYGSVNLYNNGYTDGIVVVLTVPVIQFVMGRQARVRGGLPPQEFWEMRGSCLRG